MGCQKAMVSPVLPYLPGAPYLDVGPLPCSVSVPLKKKFLRILYSEVSWDYLTHIFPIRRVQHHLVAHVGMSHAYHSPPSSPNRSHFSHLLGAHLPLLKETDVPCWLPLQPVITVTFHLPAPHTQFMVYY